MSSEQQLIELPNLGKTSVLWLNAIGVRTRQDLASRGVVPVYRAVQARGFRATKALLFSLHGALNDQHWSSLDDATKQRLLDELDGPAA